MSILFYPYLCSQKKQDAERWALGRDLLTAFENAGRCKTLTTEETKTTLIKMIR
jgi:hypothetical protein